MKISIKKVSYICIFLYFFFLSFLNFTPFYLSFAVLIVGFSILQVIKGRHLKTTSYLIFQTLFILYNLAYLLFGWSINSAHTMDALKTVCLNLAINYSITLVIDTDEDIERIIKWFIYIAIFSNLYAFLFVGFGNAGRLAQGMIRPFGSTRYTSMEFASWAIYASTISLYFYLKSKKKTFLFPIPLFWLTVILSGSRKWIIFGLLLQAGVYFYCGNKINYKVFLKRIVIISILVAIGVYAILNIPILYDIAGSRFVGYLYGTESSAGSREYYQMLALDYIGMNPLKGYGLNTFQDINMYKNWSEINYLEIAFSGGIPLLFLYYGYMFYMIYKLFKIRKYNKLYFLIMLIIIEIVLSDIISMSYLQRGEQFFFALGPLIIYLNRKGGKLYSNEQLTCNDVDV